MFCEKHTCLESTDTGILIIPDFVKIFNSQELTYFPDLHHCPGLTAESVSELRKGLRVFIFYRVYIFRIILCSELRKDLRIIKASEFLRYQNFRVTFDLMLVQLFNGCLSYTLFRI
ncbi:hypothetical protein HanRHA438_Chr04g0171631 [Helianthus annuus]|nr:hypothetical protein HanRHA438_Chr04g0171631 [Helianthus annuus]